MFKNTKKVEVGQITSIPDSYGIKLILSFNEVPEPKEVINEWIDNFKRTNKIKRIRFSGCCLHDFKVENRSLANPKSIEILGSFELKKPYDLDLPTSLANPFMEKIDELGIKLKEKFEFTKKKTDNEFKPDLIIKKLN